MVGAEAGLRLWFWFGIWMALVGPTVAQGAETDLVPWSYWQGSAEAQWALARNELLPALEAQRVAAENQKKDKLAFFEGNVRFDSAFPRMTLRDLSDPYVVDGLLLALDDQGERRAVLRQASSPAVGANARQQRVLGAYHRLLNALDEVDALDRRLLLGVRAHLADRPDLTKEALQAFGDSFEALSTKVRSLPKNTPQEKRAEILRALSLADADRVALQRVVETVRIRALVPGAPMPELSSDREQLKVAQAYTGARIRLQLLLPVMPPELAEEVNVEIRAARALHGQRNLDEMLKQARVSLALTQSPDGEKEPLEVWEPRLVEAQERYGAAQQNHADLPEDTSESARKIIETEIALWDVRRTEARWAIDQLAKEAAPGINVDNSATEAQTRADEAKAEAERAKREVRDAQSQRTAAFLERRQQAQQRANESWQRSNKVEQESEAQADLNRERLDAVAVVLQELAAAAPFGLDAIDLDGTYVNTRAILADLRAYSRTWGSTLLEAQNRRDDTYQRLEVERRILQENVQEAKELSETAIREPRLEALTRWAESLEHEQKAADSEVKVVKGARSVSLKHLYEAQSLRRRLTQHISDEQRAIDRAKLFDEIWEEVQIVGPGLMAFSSDRLDAAETLPTRLRDMNFLGRVIWGAFWLALVATLWGSGRRYGNQLLEQLFERFYPGFDRIIKEERASWIEGMQRLRVAVLDLVAVSLLIQFGPEDVPELMFILLVVFEVALFRSCLALYEAVSSVEPSNRPAFIRLGQMAAPVARSTVWWISLWWVSRRLALVITGDLMSGYALEQVTRFLFILGLFGLGWILLDRWAPILRKRIGQRDQGTWLVRSLSATPAFRVVGSLQALGGMLFVLVVILWDLTFQLGRGGGRLGQLVNRVSRFQVLSGSDEADTGGTPVSKAIFQAIAGDAADPDGIVCRIDVLEEVDDALTDWKKEGKRGLLAVIGDSGTGKKTMVNELSQRWSGSGERVQRFTLSRRLTDKDSVYDWLREVLHLPVRPSDSTSAIEAIEQHVKPGIYIFENAHYSFLRTVGGFNALREWLYILNATSQKRCWLLVMHQPAWRYLDRLGELINLSHFRSVISIPAFREQELRQAAVHRVKRLGYRIDFHGIVRRTSLGADEGEELQRAIAVFFRLLAESSMGNPSVAMALWARCLVQGKERSLAVHMGNVLDIRPIPDLTEAEMFALVALRTQDSLTVEELASVTNMSLTQMKSTVKHLIGRHLLIREESLVRVVTEALPAVSLTLRRRRFVHGEA